VKGAEQKTPQKAVATPKPYYRLVTPDQWEKNKQNEGTYRLDHAAWRGEQPEFRNPFAMRGNKIGAMKDHGNLNLRILGVVQVCRKVIAAKASTYEIYVPVPQDPEGKKTGRILMLNSVARLKELCYTVGDLNMFLPAAEVPDEDIVKTWQNDVTARLVDFDEAVQRLSDYVAYQEDHEPEVDVFGFSSERAQAAKAAERAQEVKQKE
jgi:hypothetical protein